VHSTAATSSDSARLSWPEERVGVINSPSVHSSRSSRKRSPCPKLL
jgi:hypothetical protein